MKSSTTYYSVIYKADYTEVYSIVMQTGDTCDLDAMMLFKGDNSALRAIGGK
jgi:hypothetical protein